MTDHLRFAIALRRTALAAAFAVPCMIAAEAGAAHTFYDVHNLVSDGFVTADHIDEHLVNSWGIAFNPNGVWWVSDADAGVSTLYDGNGNINSLVVNIPGGDGGAATGGPTGIVFNGSDDFIVSDGLFSEPARFIFAGEDGVISAWAPGLPPPSPSHQAHAVIDNSGSAGYRGLALLTNASGDAHLYATDFHNGKIDVFDNEFQPVVVQGGGFQDSKIPSDFAPFGIAAINGKLYVSYAKQDEDAEEDVTGAHLGYIDVFDADGNLIKRLVKKGKLNAPWGMVLAPSNFGEFSGMLLVGNFGDGRINAYDPVTGKFKGTLRGAPGQPVEIEGLWGLGFGNGLGAGPTNTLFFAAGPDDEEHGLFGRITMAPGNGN